MRYLPRKPICKSVDRNWILDSTRKNLLIDPPRNSRIPEASVKITKASAKNLNFWLIVRFITKFARFNLYRNIPKGITNAKVGNIQTNIQ